VSKIFVLGGNSNAGSFFVKWCLDKGHDVLVSSRSTQNSPWYLAYDPSQVNFVQIDINKDLDRLGSTLRNFAPDFVVNYASQSMVGESWSEPQDWIQTNVNATYRLLDVLYSFGNLKKYIHFSTPEVYGNVTGRISEDEVFNPSTPYATTRLAGDFFVKMWAKRYDLPALITRAGNVYGASQRPYRFIPKSIFYLSNGMKLPLHGGGSTRRNFVHSWDVAEATYLLCEEGVAGNTYHIASNDYVSIKELFDLIARKLGVDGNRLCEVTADRPGKDLDYSLGFEKISNLGWRPKVSLNEGINEVIKWFESNKPNIHFDDTHYRHKK
jgi:dTDP-glucose 4,6-dehydratase